MNQVTRKRPAVTAGPVVAHSPAHAALVPISVLVLTLNEEVNLAACLNSCSWSNDVVVFDSFSTDATVAIARSKGARCVQRAFDNYANQRNAALQEVEYKNSWVLMLDADERTPPDLVAEMAAAVSSCTSDTVMFRMRRKDFFLGRWLRRSSGYPTWFGRLVRPCGVRVEREVNELYIARGKTMTIRAHLLHFPFNRGVSYWVERHNRYATMEAQAKIAHRGRPVLLTGLLNRDPMHRRQVLKQVLYRIPMRPLIYFLYLYFLRGGFLDGRAGLAFSRMRACYELLIDLKVLELTRQHQGRAV